MATKKTSKRPAAKRASTKTPKKATKKRSTKSPTKAPKKATKKRPSKARKTTKTTAEKAPKKTAEAKPTSSAPRKRRATLSPGPANRPTQPARPRAKKGAVVEAEGHSAPLASADSMPSEPRRPVPAPVMSPTPSVSPPTPSSAEPASAPPPRPASYLDSLPQDPAALVAGVFQVVRGAAKDLRTLFAQALTIGQKSDRHDR